MHGIKHIKWPGSWEPKLLLLLLENKYIIVEIWTFIEWKIPGISEHVHDTNGSIAKSKVADCNWCSLSAMHECTDYRLNQSLYTEPEPKKLIWQKYFYMLKAFMLRAVVYYIRLATCCAVHLSIVCQSPKMWWLVVSYMRSIESKHSYNHDLVN